MEQEGMYREERRGVVSKQSFLVELVINRAKAANLESIAISDKTIKSSRTFKIVQSQPYWSQFFG